MTNRLVLVSGALSALAVLALAVLAPGARSALDLRVYDLLTRAAGVEVPVDRVALVVVDDASIAAIGQWPWPRDVLGRLVDSLDAAGASVIAFDMLLSESDRIGAVDGSGVPGSLASTDAVLARAVEEARVVVGHAFTFAQGERPGSTRCGVEPLGMVLVQPPGGPSPAGRLFQATGMICSLPAFTRAAGASGFLNAQPDRDGVLRRVPLLMAMDGQVYGSLALTAALRAGAIRELILEPVSGGRLRLTLDDRVAPLQAGGTMLARFPRGAGAFRAIPASDVLAGRMPEGVVRDHIVFVGATALGLRDVVATPVEPDFAGIEVHATIAANLLAGEFMDVASWAGGLALLGILLGGLGTSGLVVRAGLLVGSAVAIGATVILWAVAGSAVARQGVFFSPLLPSTAVVLAVASMTVLRLRHEGGRADEEQLRRERTHEFAVESLTALIEARDQPTGRHARRTREYVTLLAAALRDVPAYRSYLTPERLAAISRLAPLHDIGKIGIADAILQKPGPLTDEEYREMQKHPELGFQTILQAERNAKLTGARDREVMRIAKELVRTHHERWDGTGYPRGLAGPDIPIAGRIMALVDAYDAMVQPRVYRSAMTHEEASALIVADRGARFDPAVVGAFLRVEDRFRRIAARDGDDDPGAFPATSPPGPGG